MSRGRAVAGSVGRGRLAVTFGRRALGVRVVGAIPG